MAILPQPINNNKMQKLTMFNTKFKNVTLESVVEINDVVLMRLFNTTSVTHHELKGNLVLVTPKSNYSYSSGLCHSLFPEKIIYNNAFIYHKTDKNYMGFHADVRWCDDVSIKKQEVSRINYLNSF